jgi:mannose/fructose/N-acetylgalactosamine-specific phosphotransferase system component IIC
MPAFDGHMIVSILGIALLCAIIGLDRTAAGQFMISQPIVAGPLTGWVLGDMTAGAVIGATLELLWVLDVPVGSFVPADSTICTVSATAIAVLGAPVGADIPVIGFSILLTSVMVPVTMKADSLVRSANSRFVDKAMTALGPDLGRALTQAQFRGLASFFLKSFALCCLFIPLGLVFVGMFRDFPGFVHEAMQLFVKLLPLLGVAAVVRKISVMTLDRFVLTGFAVAALMGVLSHAPASVVLLLAAIAGWIGAVYRERRT